MNTASSAFSNPRVRLAAGLLMAPFFLQLLGLGKTLLGGGLCGELFGNNTPLGLQGAGFWYALIFMILLGIQLMYGSFLLLTRLLEMPEGMESGTYQTGIWLVGFMALLFVLTRTIGLPYPSQQGMAFGDTAPADPLSLLLIGCSVVGALVLISLNRRK